MAKENGVSKIFVHAFFRRTRYASKSALPSLEKLAQISNATGAILATVTGRFYAMDRDKRMDRIQLAYDAIVHGNAPFQAKTGIEALNQAYAREESDEFMKPTCIVDPTHDPIKIASGDIVIFMNFRSDRARELSHALNALPTLGPSLR